jgi:hypothetical protein
VQFLLVTGLIKKGNSCNQDAFVVIQCEWEKFVVEQNLSDIMETSVSITAVNCFRYYFIHYGPKDQLHHQPIDQYNGKSAPTSSFYFLPAKQKRLHKEIKNLLLSMHLDSKVYNHPRGEEEEVEIAEEPVLLHSGVVTSKASACGWEESIELDEAKTPNLSRIFEGKTQIRSNLLTTIFGELASILGNGNNAVTFNHGNGQKGLALIIKVVKSQESFFEQARKKK